MSGLHDTHRHADFKEEYHAMMFENIRQILSHMSDFSSLNQNSGAVNPIKVYFWGKKWFKVFIFGEKQKVEISRFRP
jgi:hypothetical protein